MKKHSNQIFWHRSWGKSSPYFSDEVFQDNTKHNYNCRKTFFPFCDILIHTNYSSIIHTQTKLDDCDTSGHNYEEIPIWKRNVVMEWAFNKAFHGGADLNAAKWRQKMQTCSLINQMIKKETASLQWRLLSLRAELEWGQVEAPVQLLHRRQAIRTCGWFYGYLLLSMCLNSCAGWRNPEHPCT